MTLHGVSAVAPRPVVWHASCEGYKLMAKARCTHGLLWYRECPVCEPYVEPEEEREMIESLPIWRAMSWSEREQEAQRQVDACRADLFFGLPLRRRL